MKLKGVVRGQVIELPIGTMLPDGIEVTIDVVPARHEPSEAELLRRVNLGFSADWWATYRELIGQRQAETISEADLGRLIGMSEELEKANVPRIEALGKLAQMRDCSIEDVMASLGIGLGVDE